MVKFLKNPLAIIGALCSAVALSYFFPKVAESLASPAEMYLSVLQMCIMPILVCSLIKSCSLLVSNKSSIDGIGNTVSLFITASVGVIAMSVTFAVFVPIGRYISPHVMQFAGFEYGLKPIWTTPDAPVFEKQSIVDIFSMIFTSNIFESLSRSMIMQIIYFSVVIGCSAGFLQAKQKDVFDHLILSMEEVFRRIISWVTLLLPLGVILIFSSNFAKVSLDIFRALVPVVVCALISIVLIIGILNFILAQKTNIGYFVLFNMLKEPLTITAVTGSPLSSMPVYLNALTHNVKLDEKLVSLFGPLGLAMFRAGSGLYFALLSVYAAQIFSVPFGLWDYGVVVFMSLLASFASVSSGILNIQLLAIILSPVGVPSSLIISLFVVVDPLTDPLRSVLNLYVNAFCTIFSVNGKHHKGSTYE